MTLGLWKRPYRGMNSSFMYVQSTVTEAFVKSDNLNDASVKRNEHCFETPEGYALF